MPRPTNNGPRSLFCCCSNPFRPYRHQSHHRMSRKRPWSCGVSSRPGAPRAARRCPASRAVPSVRGDAAAFPPCNLALSRSLIEVNDPCDRPRSALSQRRLPPPSRKHGRCFVLSPAAQPENALDDINEAWRRGTGKASGDLLQASNFAVCEAIEMLRAGRAFISADSRLDGLSEAASDQASRAVIDLLGNQHRAGPPTIAPSRLTIAPRLRIGGGARRRAAFVGRPGRVPSGGYGNASLSSSEVWTSSRTLNRRRPRTGCPRY